MTDQADLQLPPHGRAPVFDPNRGPCTRCASDTLRSTLNHYGARCVECYEAYCREPMPSVDVGDKRQDPVGWAKALEWRESQKERLTLDQRAMWRSALRWLRSEADERQARADRIDAARERLAREKPIQPISTSGSPA